MTRELLVSKKSHVDPKDQAYSYVYTETSTWEDLLNDWCCERGQFCMGPWKVVIRDGELSRQFHLDLKKLFSSKGPIKSMEDIWRVHDADGIPLHISETEEKKYFRQPNH